MKLLLLLIFTLTAIPYLKCQQMLLPIHGSYMNENYYMVNPSIAGIRKIHKIRFIYRQQWPGIDNGPNVQILSYDAQILDRTGLGVIIFNDKNGNHSKVGFQATLAYHVKFSQFKSTRSRLSFAASLTNTNRYLDNSKFNSSDPSIKNNSFSNYNMNFSLSYLFRNAFASITVGNFLPNRNMSGKEETIISYLATLGYTFYINKNIILEPMILLKKDDSNLIDLSTKIYYGISKETEIFGGISLSEDTAIFANVGFNTNNIYFGYGYDFNFSNIQVHGGGSHTIMIGYNFGISKTRTKCGCSIYYGDL